MHIKRIIVSTGAPLSAAIPEMLDMAQHHEAPVHDEYNDFTVYPLDSEDSAMQRADDQQSDE